MRKKFIFTLAAIAVLQTACRNEKPASPTMEIDTKTVDSLETDTTIYGRCGENFGLSTLELISDDGDTLQYIVEEDSVQTIKGGKHVGDRMAIIASTNEVGEHIVKSGINLTTLLGKWSALDRSFEIQEGGIVNSQYEEPKPYTEWKVYNGLLILSKDTFSVYELGAHSLLLENNKGIYSYKRQK